MSEKERTDYEMSKLVYSELKSAMDTSKEEGREEGRIERNIEIAKGLKDRGVSFQIISETTGLSEDEIREL